jgi:hypothetical protein
MGTSMGPIMALNEKAVQIPRKLEAIGTQASISLGSAVENSLESEGTRPPGTFTHVDERRAGKFLAIQEYHSDSS